MNKVIFSTVLLATLLTACNKPADNAPTDTTAKTSQTSTKVQTEQANSSNTDTAQTDTHADEHAHHDHNHDDPHHDHDHDHEGHDHDHSHDHSSHSHAQGTAYTCDNDKTVHLALKDNEGEKEALFTVNDISYDLHPHDGNTTHFASNEGIQDGTGMIVKLNGNSLTVNTWTVDGGEGTALLTCKK